MNVRGNFSLTIFYTNKTTSILYFETQEAAEKADDDLRAEVCEGEESSDVVVRDDFKKRVAFKVKDFLRTETAAYPI